MKVYDKTENRQWREETRDKKYWIELNHIAEPNEKQVRSAIKGFEVSLSREGRMLRGAIFMLMLACVLGIIYVVVNA